MSSPPSKPGSSQTAPVDITSPRLAPADFPGNSSTNASPSHLSQLLASSGLSGSPNLRALRAQYSATPLPPNIPLPSSRATPIGTPKGPGLALPASLQADFSRRPSVSGLTPRRPMTPANNPSDPNAPNLLDDLTDEDKARILRRHLVSRDERTISPALAEGSSRRSPHGSISSVSDDHAVSLSHRPSSTQIRTGNQRLDTEPFPVPYHAPGADVT